MEVPGEITDVIKSIPLLTKLLELDAQIYGSFPRLCMEQWLLGVINESTLSEKLETSDIDIHLQTYDTPVIIKDLSNDLMKIGGIIEYDGKEYECEEQTIEPFDPTLQPAFTGHYILWIPWKDRIVRCDLVITTSPLTDCDYTVNGLRIIGRKDVKIISGCSFETDVILEHIKQKRIVPMGQTEFDLKKLFRATKLMKQGYHLSEHLIDSFEVLLSQYEQTKENQEGGTIHTSRTIGIPENQYLIFPSQSESTKITTLLVIQAWMQHLKQ